MANKKKLSRKEKLLKSKIVNAGEKKELKNLTEQEVDNLYMDIYISMFIPIVGLILYYNYRNKYPSISKNYLAAGILGPILFIVVIYVIYGIYVISEF